MPKNKVFGQAEGGDEDEKDKNTFVIIITCILYGRMQ